MAQRLNNLNDIISVLKSGSRFYRESARKSSYADREQIFLEHADLRDNVARELSSIIEEVGGEVVETSPKEEMLKVKTKLATVFDAKEKSLVYGLEEHEDRTLEVFRKAIHHKDNSRDEAMLKDYMAKFEQSHERMRELKMAS